MNREKLHDKVDEWENGIWDKIELEVFEWSMLDRVSYSFKIIESRYKIDSIHTALKKWFQIDYFIIAYRLKKAVDFLSESHEIEI